jgi:hypothetical protein
MALNYGSLEEVHGAPFGTRVPVTKEQQKTKLEPEAQPEFTSMAQKSLDSIKKNQALVDSVTSSLPLDREPSTESFTIRQVERPAPIVERMAVRESFVDRSMSHADAAAEEKLSRILRLIEQNRTGYERPAVQDMVLYVFTGVFFLFTFDTFVQLGKSMRPIKTKKA